MLPTPPGQPQSSAPGHKSRILVVDDNPFNIDVLSRLLRHKGYNVSIVDNGPEALDKVRDDGFDLVLLDIMMPGMNGIEVLRAMRRNFAAVELPIIMLTALSETERMIEAFREGADDYITRPVDLAITLLRIEAQLRVREQARAQVGELHKIGGSVRSRPQQSALYCAQCSTAQRNPGSACFACDAFRPGEGWPRVDASHHPWLGQTLGGRYFLEQLIGQGSVGNVYRANDLDLGRDFAIKVIDFGDQISRYREDLRTRTLLEVEALVRLTNPYVVKIYQVIHLKDEAYALVMDLVRGQTLERHLETHGRLDPVMALETARQVALALHEAHSIGILHRDIKPANIMLEQMTTGGYFVRLLDFGIVQMISQPISDPEFCGTPAYSPPEQILGVDPVDERADIYALGATLYHMLTGEPPFGKITHEEDTPGTSNILMLLQHHLYTALPSLPGDLDVPALLCQGLDALVQQMMAKEPTRRFTGMGDLLGAIEGLLIQLQGRE